MTEVYTMTEAQRKSLDENELEAVAGGRLDGKQESCVAAGDGLGNVERRTVFLTGPERVGEKDEA